MTFAQWVTNLGTDPIPFTEIGQRDYLKFVLVENKVRIKAALDEKASLEAALLVRRYGFMEWIDALEAVLTSRIFGKGPKIFRPTSEQMFALENMTLNLTFDDFQMPFDTIVIELPEEYRKARTLSTFEPHLSFVLKDDVKFILHSVSNGEVAIKSWWAAYGEEEMETWFDTKLEWKDVGTLETAKDEAELERQVRRASLNYCLLLDEVGIKREGPAVPNRYAQLVKWCQKKNKHTEKNKAALQAEPIIYSLAHQDIVLMRTEKGETVPGDPTGRKMPTHWRRGHYRMQRFGVGLTQTKRIRIPMTLVNKDSLVKPIVTEYKT